MTKPYDQDSEPLETGTKTTQIDGLLLVTSSDSEDFHDGLRENERTLPSNQIAAASG